MTEQHLKQKLDEVNKFTKEVKKLRKESKEKDERTNELCKKIESIGKKVHGLMSDVERMKLKFQKHCKFNLFSCCK